MGFQAIVFACLIATASAQSPTVIRVPVRLVTAPTLVFSREGRLLHALRTRDFQLSDNGAPQKITLESLSRPLSIAIVAQVNQDVRQYVPFIAKTGSAFDALLVGESGESALVAYNGDVSVLKDFGGDMQPALRKITARGRQARLIDAGMRAIALLKERPANRDRILLFIGQPVDRGSESALEDLRAAAGRENVSIHALTLPQSGKAFVSDTFSLRGLSSSADRGGFQADIDLARLITVLDRGREAVEVRPVRPELRLREVTEDRIPASADLLIDSLSQCFMSSTAE